VSKELKPLTDRQRQIFDFIAEYHERERIGMTIRGICQQFGIASPNGAVCHLKALVEKGWVTRRRCAARSIIPTREAVKHAL